MIANAEIWPIQYPQTTFKLNKLCYKHNKHLFPFSFSTTLEADLLKQRVSYAVSLVQPMLLGKTQYTGETVLSSCHFSSYDSNWPFFIISTKPDRQVEKLETQK